MSFEQSTFESLIQRYQFSDEIKKNITEENLLPAGVLGRLHSGYPDHSGLGEGKPFLFSTDKTYAGLEGFRQLCSVLKENGIALDEIKKREFFIEVYRFMVTPHTLNSIDWDNYATDSMFQLTFPQAQMTEDSAGTAYANATSEEERKKIIADYMQKTNPHDGKQKLNAPWMTDDTDTKEFLEGSQHKYPQCMLLFDKTTQHCFSFCTYCFRHAQVRGDEDMFLQKNADQIHRYLYDHKEVNDLLITGGDAGYIPAARLAEYVNPIIEDSRLQHIKTIRIGSRALTFKPEMLLTDKYQDTLDIFQKLYDNGIQLAWMAHFCTPRELLNPSTIAAIRRLKAHGVTVKSQSPIMNHISLFTKADGSVDVERSAQNWIDLANILAMLGVGFHSMYCARPTGEHHYFTAPLADIEKVFSRIYHSLSSINRPSRHISMTISAGKFAILGTAVVNGEKLFALQFTESRNMEWMDQVVLAKYDKKANKIDLLEPYNAEKFFFEDELKQIEEELEKNYQ